MSRKKDKKYTTFRTRIGGRALSNKNIINNVYNHYMVKSHIEGLPVDRPNKRITSFTHNNNTTFFDMLCSFVLNN